jgi:class 3 adenylate cyclase/predicted ATPase
LGGTLFANSGHCAGRRRDTGFRVTNGIQQIAVWLEQLGMSEYAGRFAENRIDFSVLRDLTDQDLKELGVVLGDRRKLLRAIAELDAVARTATKIATPAPQDAAERRQVTVMFCDLVGSTALSTHLDPEDLRDIIGAYHRCCAATVERNGGFVAKYMGDGVLIYFGYPQAHEHDAERAVQVGLALAEAVPKLVTSAGSPLQVRIGIATGLVVVGDLIGSGEAQERGVVGETPNLAARLQGIAEPGMVVIAEGTRRLVGSLFELNDLGAQNLKGIAGPVRAWAALRTSSIESRFDALRAAGTVALVGREKEIDLLMQRWSSAKNGEGQVVLLSGEAGIGKSRLTAALLERLAAEPHARLRYFCSPQHTDSAFYPIIGQMERAAGLSREDTSQAKLDKLDSMLRANSTSPEDAALFADMLSLPNDGRYPALALTPQQRRQRTLDALVARIAALARTTPALMIFEDAHWSDPTSLEVLRLAIDQLASHRVMITVTFRPEFAPPWMGRSHMTALAINRLAHDDVGAMIDRVIGSKALPANVRQDILKRADGIPLFVEEMTKAVMEAENESEARRTAASVPSPALAVPASLHASLMSRLDRLGPAKQVAQTGAAIGREFSHRLLAAVACKPEAELGAALDRLLTAGLLFRQGLPPNATYLFNHALVQDAAYGTLLREPRRALHTRIAETLEQQFADIAESQPELLARHCTEAGLIEKAAALWSKAGRRALARSALKEAAEQLARALGQVARLAGTAALRREQIKLQIDLSNALIHTKGHASPETKASFEQARLLIERAEALGEPIDDPLLLFSVLYGFWVGNRMAFKGDVACELAEQFHVLAQNQSATVPRMIGHMVMGISLILVGDVSDGRFHLDRLISLYDPVEHRPLATRFGHDIRMTAFCWRALALWILGYPKATAMDIEHALKDAREVGHAATSMFALSHASLAHILRRDHAAASALADELVALAEDKGSLYWKSYGLMLQGWLLARTGKASDAVPVATAAIAAIRSTGATAYAPWYMSYVAVAHAELGQFDDAWRCIAEATNAAETTGEKWCEADIHRIAGDIALMLDDPDTAKAEVSFERALSIARKQKANSFELRAAMSMARFWRGQGKRKEASDLLMPVLGGFTEDSDTPDLIEAKALLDTLG